MALVHSLTVCIDPSAFVGTVSTALTSRVEVRDPLMVPLYRLSNYRPSLEAYGEQVTFRYIHAFSFAFVRCVIV